MNSSNYISLTTLRADITIRNNDLYSKISKEVNKLDLPLDTNDKNGKQLFSYLNKR